MKLQRSIEGFQQGVGTKGSREEETLCTSGIDHNGSGGVESIVLSYLKLFQDGAIWFLSILPQSSSMLIFGREKKTTCLMNRGTFVGGHHQVLQGITDIEQNGIALVPAH